MTPVKGIVVEDIQYCNANDLPELPEFMLHSELSGVFFWGGESENHKFCEKWILEKLPPSPHPSTY